MSASRTWTDVHGRTRMKVPPLDGCNSWIVVRRGTTDAVRELYDASIVSCVDSERFDVFTARDHLQRLNRVVAA